MVASSFDDGAPVGRLTPAGWKLAAGQIVQAWREWPAQVEAAENFPAGPPILVTGAHRSGTTWFGAMISTRGLLHYHEPFNPNQGHWPQSLSYAPIGRRWAEADSLAGKIARGRLRSSLRGVRQSSILMPGRLLSLPAKRVLVKDPLVCLMAGYLAVHHRFRVWVLFRHPCGFVQSVTKQGWPVAHFLRQFLSDPVLMADHLSSYARLLGDLADEDSPAAAAALHGCIYQVISDQRRAASFEMISYEDLCADPILRFRDIHHRLGIPYGPEDRLRHEALSQREAAAGETNPHEVQRRSRQVADAWRNGMEPATLRQIRGTWESFSFAHEPPFSSWVDWD